MSQITLWNCFLVGIGGMFGSILRFMVGRVQKEFLPEAVFPIATCFVNLFGSFFLGYLAAKGVDRLGTGYLLLAVGFCGGLTTFSTFSLEVMEAIQAGRPSMAFIYTFTSLFGGFAGVVIGQRFGQPG
jgi:fluoride exporter